MFSHAALMWLDEVKHVTSNTPLSDQLTVRHILHTVMSSSGVRVSCETPPVAATGLAGLFTVQHRAVCNMLL